MKFIIRLLKLFVVIIVCAISIPFTALMWMLSLFLVIPLGCTMYLINGDVEVNFDWALEFCTETLACEIGMAPEIFIIEKLLYKDEKIS